MSDQRVRLAMRRLERLMSEDVDFGRLADAVCLSRYHFHRRFTDELGVTPGGYLRRIRLDAAAVRLRWTREDVWQIADGLGYRSQGSFTHAFVKRFSSTPSRLRRDCGRWPEAPVDHVARCKITLQHIGGFHCLCRRYFGPIHNTTANWCYFLTSIADVIPSQRSIYIGLMHDDPRFTPEDEVRYDCCVTLDATLGDVTACKSSANLEYLFTRPGLYAAAVHEGPRTLLASTYSLILDYWLPYSRYTPTDDPAIEIYKVPPGRCDPERLACTVLAPLY